MWRRYILLFQYWLISSFLRSIHSISYKVTNILLFDDRVFAVFITLVISHFQSQLCWSASRPTFGCVGTPMDLLQSTVFVLLDEGEQLLPVEILKFFLKGNSLGTIFFLNGQDQNPRCIPRGGRF
jgi:hypothetical protein